LALWRATIQMEPNAIPVRQNLAAACVHAGLIPCALEYYPAVIQARPFDADSLSGYGWALSVAGRLKEARIYFERARAAAPQQAKPWYNLALLAEQEGNAGEAERDYRQALQIDPNLGEARENLAMLLVQRQELTEAESQFRAAGSFLNLGKLLAMEGRFADAERAYRSAIQADQHRAEAQAALERLPQRR